MNEEKTILIVGGPSNGFAYYGPFASEAEAIEFAEEQEFDDNWWVAPLNPTN